MHWTEWAAIALCVLLAIPVLLLFVYLAAIAWAAVAGSWQKQPLVETTEAIFGTLTKNGSQWSGAIETDGKELAIDICDVNGRPNPEWLQKLPALLQALPRWDQAARQSVADLTDGYELDSISDGLVENVDFVLGFIYEEEPWGETLFVQFHQGQVVNWSAVD